MLRSHRLGLAALLFSVLFLPFFSSFAAADTFSQPDTFKQPDLISFGGGYFDFDKTERHKQSGDMRLEYRWGMSLLPLISSYFKSWDPYVQFHPMVGAEITTLGAFYGTGGWAMDGYIGRHGIFTWSEGIGYYEPGSMTSLHGVFEFRSMMELGYRFDNEMRLTAQVSHISDAGLTVHNPGAEIAGVYLHVPVNLFCQKP